LSDELQNALKTQKTAPYNLNNYYLLSYESLNLVLETYIEVPFTILEFQVLLVKSI
jgi:hypothetical protein